MMNLFFRKTGSGKPLIILHGLYGSSDNWHSIGRQLAATHTVYLLDQRNHGKSPHDPEHNYKVMSSDLYAFMQQQTIEKAIILGHSMGGKTAMAFGLAHPEKVTGMIVVDISPLSYDSNNQSSAGGYHMQILNAIGNIAEDTLTSREEADKMLAKDITSPVIRQFLLKNLKRSGDGKFRWALNIQALAANMPAIFAGIIHEQTTDPRSIPDFPLLFIKGERSPYIDTRDEVAIQHYFPKAQIVTIPKAGHWLHAEQPKAFLEAINNFLSSANL